MTPPDGVVPGGPAFASATTPVSVPGGPGFSGHPLPPDVPCDPVGDDWRGPPGPMGPPGPANPVPGPAGPPGADSTVPGPAGAAGLSFIQGSGPPVSAMPVGTTYLDVVTGNIWLAT